MGSFKNRDLQDLYGFKKGICCFFISQGSPKSLLIIQLRMVGRKIMKIQLTVLPLKILYTLPSVPLGSIDQKIDDFPFETYRDAFENPQKAVRIAPRPFHHPMQSLSRSYPSKEIQPLLMLTSGIDIRLSSFLCPYTTQLRMKTEPAFILKQKDPSLFALFGQAKFFLTPSEIPLPPPGRPEQTGRSAASRNTPTDGSTAGHVVHGSLFDETASNIPSKPPRPTAPEESHILSETWTRPHLILSLSDRQTGKVGQGEIGPGQPQPPPGCLYGSISPPYTESNPTTRQFGWISTRLKARDSLRFEFPSRLREFHRPFATRSPGSSWEGQNGNWGTQKISLPLVANTVRSGLDHHPSTHLRKIQRLPYRPILQETSARSPRAQESLKPMLAFNRTIILRKELLYDN